jgi:hypothetical protein
VVDVDHAALVELRVNSLWVVFPAVLRLPTQDFDAPDQAGFAVNGTRTFGKVDALEEVDGVYAGRNDRDS